MSSVEAREILAEFERNGNTKGAALARRAVALFESQGK